MLIEHLDLALNEKELNILFNKFFTVDLPVSDIVISLEDDMIKLTGSAKKIVTVPFTAWLKIAPKGASKIGLKIVRIDAVGPVGNMLRGLIWNLFLMLLPTKTGVESSGNRLQVNINKLMTYWDTRTHINFEDIKVENGLLKIKLSGDVEPPKALEQYLEPAHGFDDEDFEA